MKVPATVAPKFGKLQITELCRPNMFVNTIYADSVKLKCSHTC